MEKKYKAKLMNYLSAIWKFLRGINCGRREQKWGERETWVVIAKNGNREQRAKEKINGERERERERHEWVLSLLRVEVWEGIP